MASKCVKGLILRVREVKLKVIILPGINQGRLILGGVRKLDVFWCQVQVTGQNCSKNAPGDGETTPVALKVKTGRPGRFIR